jgi:CHAT domain-containing protein
LLEKVAEGRATLEGQLKDAWKLHADERETLARKHEALRDQLRRDLDAAYAILDEHAEHRATLRTPSSGEVWLIYHEVPDGWVGFAQTIDGVEVARLGAVDVTQPASALASPLLDPFAAQLTAAKQVHVLSMGPLLGVEFAALPYRDGAVVDAMPVVYSIDLPTVVPTARGERALVIGDPATRVAGRLPKAKAEAEAVAEQLRAAEWSVDFLADDEVTHTAVVAAMDGASLLHYAGHGEAGDTGWDASLILANEESLRVSDILAIPRVPDTVVMTGCETGRAETEQGLGGMHLAAAFVLGGSSLVIAASKVVPDDVAAAYATMLYDDGTQPTVEKFQRAQRRMRARFQTDWSTFRVWVP